MILALIVCFLNEEETLPTLLESIETQSRPPDEVLLVDDGSNDGSLRIADEFAARHAYASVQHRRMRPSARDRLAAAAELVAFQDAVDGLRDDWELVGKVDADLRLTADTLETLEEHFRDDPRLGMAGPHLCELRADGMLARMVARDEHVHGGMCLYRRPCWEQIQPLPTILGWDTIDEVRAALRGWRTRSVEIPTGDPIHLRPMGSYAGRMRGFRNWGCGAWAYGEHPLHILLVSVQRAVERGAPGGALHYAAGWTWAAARRLPRAEAQVRDYVRRDQLRRIRARARREVERGRRTFTLRAPR